VLEASDGAEALIIAEQSRPDLIITDILMPTMDGYEFVRCLRTKPGFASPPIIFYTAHCLERDAEALAAKCGVSQILCKPVESGDLLMIVEQELRGGAAPDLSSPVDDAFDREQLILLTRKLAEQTENLRNSNLRLKALTELGLQLNLNRNRAEVANTFCRAARYVVGATCATVVFVSGRGQAIEGVYSSGLHAAGEAALKSMGTLQGVLQKSIREEPICRGFNPGGDPVALGLPQAHPPIYSYLAVRVASPSHTHARRRARSWHPHGVLFLSNKLGTEQFGAVDEELARMLGAQLAVACENYKLLEEAKQRSAELERQLEKQMEMEAALRRGEERLQAILGNTNAVVYLVNPDGRVLLANRAAQRVLGAPLDQLLNRHIRHLLPGTVADTLWAKDLKVLAAKVPMVSEDTIPQSDGPHTYMVTRFPLLDSNGNVYALGGIATDFTEHNKVQEQLRHAQRMESIGRMAGGVAHDFNNMLTVINGYCHRLLEDPPGGQGEYELRQIAQAGESAASITRQLLAFSRRQTLEPKVLNINEVVARVQTILRRLIGEDIELVADLNPEIGPVLADPAQLEQVLMNLAVNARDAMPDGGVLSITSGGASLPDPRITAPAGTSPGEYVVLSVTDTGTGIDDLVKAQMFEPFFTTKPEDKGTGLGLSTVYGIVRQSGGLIAVDSAPGRGSTFHIYLPRVDGADTPVPKAVAAVQTLHGDETILLVEDDAAVRIFAEQALKSHGYRVLSTGRVEDAVASIERDPMLVDLVVTDVVMPSMTGKQLADRLRAIRPNLKILFVSGYSFDVIEPKGITPGDVEFLAKPFTSEALAAKIRGMIGVPVHYLLAAG
jgi:PAS domain S-box-containing protein